ncbi:hypothetical protein PRIPAC_80326 [Pristionchus pacificus]|uniref:Uncharacterized protein n=1 Tax=Pristionchus pacificus TaxID=54126 RepID=A0A2A6CM56_PRIPA|nr:hypothetical protein PRIPAC_80326 [Pristionchus pacificus]|eukprot:PDM79282.1 hypothetical protein PRIPAC_31861 [Pristionchus pacificus]
MLTTFPEHSRKSPVFFKFHTQAIMNYNAVASDVENAAKALDPKQSVFIHRHTCQNCGKACEREILPEHLHHYTIGYHPPPTAWHAAHAQTIHYTVNVFLVAIVIFLTFFAAKFLYGK